MSNTKYVMSKWKSDVIFAFQSHFSPDPGVQRLMTSLAFCWGLPGSSFPAELVLCSETGLSRGLNTGQACTCVHARVLILKVLRDTASVSQKGEDEEEKDE